MQELQAHAGICQHMQGFHTGERGRGKGRGEGKGRMFRIAFGLLPVPINL